MILPRNHHHHLPNHHQICISHLPHKMLALNQDYRVPLLLGIVRMRVSCQKICLQQFEHLSLPYICLLRKKNCHKKQNPFLVFLIFPQVPLHQNQTNHQFLVFASIFGHDLLLFHPSLYLRIQIICWNLLQTCQSNFHPT